MHKLAATLIVKFGEDLFEKKEEVRDFLADPDEVKKYYDEKDSNGEYVNRAEVISIRNAIGTRKKIDGVKVNKRVKDCLEGYRNEIKAYITKMNGVRFIDNKYSFFPMFFTDDQIVLGLFSLSHYLADAHMPLHCDKRDFSSGTCGNIHQEIEKEWENWIISGKDSKALKKILSETERAAKFLKGCFNDKEPSWKNYQYPSESILSKFDEELGDILWEDREIELYKKDSLWEETVGITYASYCLSSRLLAFNDKVRNVPKGKKNFYVKNFDEDKVREIDDENWKSAVDREGMGEELEKDRIRKYIYDFAVNYGGDDLAFNYLSLLVLVDSVECVAKVWGRIVKDHLDITYEPKSV
jgi:hypothetical protein